MLPVAARADVDTTPPVLSVTITTTNNDAERARIGDRISVYATANETITAPLFLIAGNDVSARAGATDNEYYAFYDVTENDVDGPVSISVSFYEDFAHNSGPTITQTTDGTQVVIDNTAPEYIDAENQTLEAESAAGAALTVSLVADPIDGDLTPTCTPGVGTTVPLGVTTISCTVTDRAGNTADATFDVTVVDTTPPALTLLGDAEVNLTKGDAFTDEGATAEDLVSGSVPVAVTGTVDTAQAGTYTLTYEATDGAGNRGEITRAVTVSEPRSGGGGGGGRSRRTTTAEEAAPPTEPLASTPTITTEDNTAPGEVLGAAAYNFTRYLRRGDTGADVSELQKLLAAKGYFSGEITEYFGPVTESALKAYQAANGLEGVGYVGPRTLVLLNGGTAAPTVEELLKKLEALKAELAKLQNS